MTGGSRLDMLCYYMHGSPLRFEAVMGRHEAWAMPTEGPNPAVNLPRLDLHPTSLPSIRLERYVYRSYHTLVLKSVELALPGRLVLDYVK